MDDIFNPTTPVNDNSDNNESSVANTPEQPTQENAAPQTPAADSAPTQGYTPYNNTPVNTGSYNTGAYNSAPYNAGAYNSAPYNQGGASNNAGAYTSNSYSTGTYGTGDYNANPYNQQGNAYQPYNNQQNAYTSPKASPKKSKKGKSVFAILICICIIIASVAIGASISGNEPGTGNNSGKTEANGDKIGGADPNTEDSPVSFSEYSGKGAMTPEQVYSAVKEINVGVLVYSQNQMVGEGSGIIVGEDDTNTYTYIITAAHVISDGGVSVQVQFSDGTEIDADIVGSDPKTDVGVLRVKKTGFKSATFGNSDKLTVGQTVYAIGNPGGTEFFGSFTSGIISAIDRPIASSSSAYDLPCIQHTAAINPGNSGGALVNEYGQVIALNSSKISSTEYEGMGFSVPSTTVLEIYKDIVANGYVTNRPMLGISYYAVSSDYTYSAIAWRNNIPYGSIVIATMSEDSDLAAKGVRVGDIITAVNGTDLNSTDVLLEVIEGSNVGDTITLSVCRLSNSGSVTNKFDVKVKLIEDKGQNTTPQQEQTTDPFSSYFGGNFGY